MDVIFKVSRKAQATRYDFPRNLCQDCFGPVIRPFAINILLLGVFCVTPLYLIVSLSLFILLSHFQKEEEKKNIYISRFRFSYLKIISIATAKVFE